MVLSGGGAYGAYEVGVMLALFQGASPATGGLPLDVQLFSGTSIGAFNASAMVAHARGGLAAAARRLRDIWLEEIARPPGGCDNGMYRVRGTGALNLRCLFRPEAVADLVDDGDFFLRQLPARVRRFADAARSRTPDAFTRAVLEQSDVSSLFDLEPFHQLLRRVIPPDDVRESGLGLKLVATNFDRGEVKVFTGDDVAGPVGHLAILGSAAVPGFFPPVEIDGEIYVDGGALMNSPLQPAVRGSEILHVVYMDPNVDRIPIENLSSTLGVMDRLLVTSFAFSMNQDIEMVQDFNRSLDLVDAAEPGGGSFGRAVETVRRQLGELPDFRRTVIHRYHPVEDLGGALGFLDLTYDQVSNLIDRGYRDTATHDCDASGCVIPDRGGRQCAAGTGESPALYFPVAAPTRPMRPV